MRPSSIAIIPARGGSKRLPRKNILAFLGKPIIAYTIESALACGLFDRIIVSTEDAEIATIAQKFGAEAVDRPQSLATDSSTVVEVCLDAIDREEQAGHHYTTMCCLYATSPLRNAQDIRDTMNLVTSGRCDFAMAITEYSLPPHQALREGRSGTLEPMWPELVHLSSQKVGRLYVDCGSTYAVSVPKFRDARTFYGPGLLGHIMPRDRSVDIDVKEDLELAIYFGKKMGL
jgi:pseudaminic acid cytidylyltransferase